jgi:hypothetical protein
MKYLKTYRLFESLDIDIINDFFLEVQDLGFDVNIKRKKDIINIKIKKTLTKAEFDEEFNRSDFKRVDSGPFRLSLIKDSILSVVSYLDEMGYNLESIFCFGADFKSGDIIELNDFEELSGNTFISTIMIDFELKNK